MHLLAAKPGGFVDEEGIIDLDQAPADIIILTAADSQLAALSAGLEVSELANNSAAPSVRIANWLQLLKPAAFDLYEQKVLCHAKLIVVSLLGGQNYWNYGFERLCDWAKQPDHHLILVPGDDSEDPQLTSASNVSSLMHCRVWRYLRESGVENAKHLLHSLAQSYFNCDFKWREPQVLPRAQLYMPACGSVSANELSSSSLSNNQPASLHQWQQLWAADDQQLLDKDSAALVKQRVAVLFYRSHLQSANTQMFDQLIDQLRLQGLNPLPIAIASLKDPESITLVNSLLERAEIKLILNTTGFASNRAQTPE
ncbi:MAG: cobaltochelatase CobN, partial [Oceanospirillaceae bacterium]